MDKISRQSAYEAGLSKFYTGIPCRNGHDNFRYVSSGICVSCHRDQRRNYKPCPPEAQRLVVQVHRDDVATVWAFIEYLNAARVYKPPTADMSAIRQAKMLHYTEKGQDPVEYVNGQWRQRR